jgi:hypothetical protein
MLREQGFESGLRMVFEMTGIAWKVSRRINVGRREKI